MSKISRKAKRPEPPRNFDHTPESYLQHNRYFNEAEKFIDEIGRIVDKYLQGQTKGVVGDACEANDTLWKIHDMIVCGKTVPKKEVGK